MNKVVLLIFTIALFMGSCSKKDSPVSNAAAASTTASPAGTTCVPIEIDSPGIKATIVYFDDKKGDLDKITIVENGTTSVSQVGFNGIDDEVGSYYYRKGSQGFGWSYPGVCNSVDYKDSNQNSIYNDWFVVRKFPDGKDRVCEVDKDFTRAHSHGRDSVIYDSSGNVISIHQHLNST